MLLVVVGSLVVRLVPTTTATRRQQRHTDHHADSKGLVGVGKGGREGRKAGWPLIKHLSSYGL